MTAAPRQRRVKRKVGDILRIDMGDGQHTYAQVAADPLVVFFEGIFTGAVSVDEIVTLPVAFTLNVFRHAVTKGIWPVVGSRPLEPENRREPFFYKQDAISGRLFLHHSSFAEQNYECSATLEECIGLECAAVWEPEHVVDRLRDKAAGRLNRWEESMRIDTEAIPA